MEFNETKRWTKFFVQLAAILGTAALFIWLLNLFAGIIRDHANYPKYVVIACITALTGKVIALVVYVARVVLKGF